MERSDLPEGQQSNLGPFFNESTEEINVSIRKLVAGLDTLGIRPYADNAPSWSWVLFCLDAIEKLQREVARVRADVAEDLADLVESLCPARGVVHAGDHCDYRVAAAAIREHAGKGLPSHAPAPSEHPPRCTKCGGLLGTCATCGMPAQCGEAFCVQHTDPPDWSPPALPDVVGTQEHREG